ncbi:K(+)-transporting ATPase subunit C [Aeromicrobium sp. CTD01-1L150]|uniref:K(+)-transporting ATPase subunit C n=1 Tax=Aeromicrobium sp. CTD01-1L150 TaxID=3341830 RepID=UPI0035C21908
MRRQLVPALGMLVFFTMLTGVLYPLTVTGIGQAVFPDQANGSLARQDGTVVGSRLIAQGFTEPGYVHPRPSAVGYDPRDSGGANLGATNPDLLAAIDARAKTYREVNGLPTDHDVPVDAVTGSGSGLDPMISVANATLQAPRVARVRDLPVGRVLGLIEDHTAGRGLGFLGEEGVNVLDLNLALDATAG